MGIKICWFIVFVVVFAVVVSGFLVIVIFVFVVYLDCFNNYFCLWFGSNGMGIMVFK